jgi:hypothetical protein
MTLKERIENNLTLWALSLAATAFAAGVTVDRWAKDVIGPPDQVSACKSENWQVFARKDDWIPTSQCPTLPLKVQVSSPGTGTTLALNETWPSTLKIPFVITLSRPLGDNGDIGFVVKPKNSQNFFVVFPLIARTWETNSYRAQYGIELPTPIQKGIEYEVRGLLVDKKNKMGDRFTDISQILAADQSIMLTEPISVVVEK